MSIDMKTLAEQVATIKVLIVDDETYMRKVVATLLESIGVQTIYEAEDGSAGLDLIRRKNPSVVILDWQMPGLDGPGFHADRSLAEFLSVPGCADHHADRTWRTLPRR